MIKLDYQYVGRGVLGYPASSNDAPPVLDQAIIWGDVTPPDCYVYLIASPWSPNTVYVGTASNLDAKLREHIAWLESAGIVLDKKALEKELPKNKEAEFAVKKPSEGEPLFYEYQEDEFIWKNDGVVFIGNTDVLERDCYLKWHIFKPRVAVSGDEKIYEFGGKIWNTATKRLSALHERQALDGPETGRLYFPVSNYEIADSNASPLVYIDVEWVLARLVGRALSNALFHSPGQSHAPHKNLPTHIANLRIEALRELQDRKDEVRNRKDEVRHLRSDMDIVREKLRNAAKAGRCKNNLLEQIADWSLGVKPSAKHVEHVPDAAKFEYMPSTLSGGVFPFSNDSPSGRRENLRDTVKKMSNSERNIAEYRYRENFFAVDISLSIVPALATDGTQRKSATDAMISNYLKYSLNCQRDGYDLGTASSSGENLTDSQENGSDEEAHQELPNHIRPSGPARWSAGEEL